MPLGLRLKALLLLLMSSGLTGAGNLDRPVLYAVYGSDIVERLKRIQGPDRDGPNGTLVAALYGRTPAYIECRFADAGTTLLCEAVAGAYPPKASRPASAVSAATDAGLKNAGYRRDAYGHAVFAYRITKDSGVWGGASVVILAPLIDVFGARAGSKIEIIAPLAPERDEDAILRELRRG